MMGLLISTGLAAATVVAAADPAPIRPPNVPTVTLNNGVKMPAISIGTGRLNSSTAQRAVSAALRVGYRGIDTAFIYRNHDGVARAAAASGHARADVFITTKVPAAGLGPGPARAIEQSLRQLNVSYIDLLLVHAPPIGGCHARTCPALQQQWQALEQLVAKKQVRALGVSNFGHPHGPACFRCLDQIRGLRVAPAVNQVEFHVGAGPDPCRMVSYCRSRGMVLQAYSPLANRHREVLSDRHPTTAIGARLHKSAAQIALRWVWQHGVPFTTRSANPTHLAQDLDIFSWALSRAEMAQLDAADSPPYCP